MSEGYEFNRSNPAVAELDLRGPIGIEDGVDPRDVANDVRSLESGTLRVTVNSPGGSIDAGIDIYNTLRGFESRGGTIITYNTALAASIASVIMMAGSRRITAPHSRMMIHEAMALGLGRAADFEKLSARLRDATSNIASIYAERTGKPVDHWLPLMDAETWFSDKQALDEGLATEIGRGYDPENFQRASEFALLNQYKGWSGFDAEALGDRNVGRMLSAANLRRLTNARDAARKAADDIDELLGDTASENDENEADSAPEGDPVPSLTAQEQAKADLERRLALIRL